MKHAGTITKFFLLTILLYGCTAEKLMRMALKKDPGLMQLVTDTITLQGSVDSTIVFLPAFMWEWSDTVSNDSILLNQLKGTIFDSIRKDSSYYAARTDSAYQILKKRLNDCSRSRAAMADVMGKSYGFSKVIHEKSDSIDITIPVTVTCTFPDGQLHAAVALSGVVLHSKPRVIFQPVKLTRSEEVGVFFKVLWRWAKWLLWIILIYFVLDIGLASASKIFGLSFRYPSVIKSFFSKK